MSTFKQSLIDRVASQIAAFTAITVVAASAAKQKGELAEALRKASSGFKSAARHEAVSSELDIVKNLAAEIKSIKRNEYDSTEKFAEAISTFQEQAKPALEELAAAVENLPDDIGDDKEGVGNLGERTTFSVNFTDKEGNVVNLGTRKSQKDSKTLHVSPLPWLQTVQELQMLSEATWSKI